MARHSTCSLCARVEHSAGAFAVGEGEATGGDMFADGSCSGSANSCVLEPVAVVFTGDGNYQYFALGDIGRAEYVSGKAPEKETPARVALML